MSKGGGLGEQAESHKQQVLSAQRVQRFKGALFSFQVLRTPPFRLSLHPFAMLTAPRAAEYARKQSKPAYFHPLEKSNTGGALTL